MSAVGVLLVIGPLFFAQAGNPILSPPSNSTTTIRNEITLQAPPMDKAEVRAAAVESSQGVLTTVIAPTPVQWANELLGLPDIYRTTPDDLTWNNSAIRGLAELIRNVAAALIALAVIGKGVAIMVGRDEPSSLGRLFFAAALSFGNLVFWQWGIQLNNAITSAISAPALSVLIQPHLTTTIDPMATAGTVVLLIVYAVVALMLMFSLLFRLGLIDILIAVGSLALLCKATQETDYIASHYTRLSIAVLFSQVLIVICLRCASVLATLGTGGVLGTLISVAILWLARSAPQQILAGSSNSQGSRLGSLAVRMIMRRVGR